jgi:hypothetical protein
LQGGEALVVVVARIEGCVVSLCATARMQGGETLEAVVYVALTAGGAVCLLHCRWCISSVTCATRAAESGTTCTVWLPPSPLKCLTHKAAG